MLTCIVWFLAWQLLTMIFMCILRLFFKCVKWVFVKGVVILSIHFFLRIIYFQTETALFHLFVVMWRKDDSVFWQHCFSHSSSMVNLFYSPWFPHDCIYDGNQWQNQCHRGALPLFSKASPSCGQGEVLSQHDLTTHIAMECSLTVYALRTT